MWRHYEIGGNWKNTPPKLSLCFLSVINALRFYRQLPNKRIYYMLSTLKYIKVSAWKYIWNRSTIDTEIYDTHMRISTDVNFNNYYFFLIFVLVFENYILIELLLENSTLKVILLYIFLLHDFPKTVVFFGTCTFGFICIYYTVNVFISRSRPEIHKQILPVTQTDKYGF